MNYTYSICHTDEFEIEYPKEKLNESDVIKLFKEYPWQKKLTEMNNAEAFYNPSLDFKNIANEKSLGISGHLENNEVKFSLWYKRPIKTKPFFGLFGTKEKMKVIDKWNFDKNKALEYLEVFLNKNYSKMERLMNE